MDIAAPAAIDAVLADVQQLLAASASVHATAAESESTELLYEVVESEQQASTCGISLAVLCMSIFISGHDVVCHMTILRNTFISPA